MRRVFCLGNPLHGDDGVGLRVAEAMRRLSWPKDVEVIDLGAHVLELPSLLVGCMEAVLVDASRDGAPAGRVSVHCAEAILQTEVNWTISHEADLRFALRSAQAEWGALPPTQVVTVAVTDIKIFKPGLSPAVERAVPVAVAKIAGLLRVKASL